MASAEQTLARWHAGNSGIAALISKEPSCIVDAARDESASCGGRNTFCDRNTSSSRCHLAFHYCSRQREPGLVSVTSHLGAGQRSRSSKAMSATRPSIQLALANVAPSELPVVHLSTQTVGLVLDKN